MKLITIGWLFFMLSFFILLYYSNNPYMMFGMIVGVIIGIDLQILEQMKGNIHGN